MKGTILVALSVLVFCGHSYAQSDCKELSRYHAVVECAESRSPEIQSALLEVEKANAEIKAGRQWRNPEFSAEHFQGKVGANDQSETDLAFGIPIELGGKISAKTALARGELAVTEATLAELRAKVRSQAVLKLHRLRQVLHEEEVINEAIGTFSKLVAQYSKRPGLSPEQQISLSVYRLSKSEYELKKAAVVDELLVLNSYFQLAVGANIEQIKKALPEGPKSWPAVSATKSEKPSSRQRVLKAELDAANAGLSVAQSEAWPTVTLGPSFKMLSEAGQSSQLMGVNLSFPIPLFNFNGGAKAAAAASVRLSEVKQEFGLREQGLKREELRKVYEQSVTVLTGSLSHQEIEKRHIDAERLFARGVVPSSLVIEAHRVAFELEKTRHERELKALETLFDLYAIDGKILEVSL